MYRPDFPTSIFVWSGSDQPGFEYPELSAGAEWGIPALQAKPNLGIALSGGGYRAATLSLGWVRALYLVRASLGGREGRAGLPVVECWMGDAGASRAPHVHACSARAAAIVRTAQQSAAQLRPGPAWPEVRVRA